NGYSLAMTSGGRGAGGDAEMGPFNVSNNQEWDITWGGAQWELINMGNGLCANDQYGSAASGTQAHKQTCDTRDRRQARLPLPIDLCNPTYATCVVFTLTPNSNKYNSSIQSPYSNGVDVTIRGRNDNNYNQLWSNECHNSSGWYIC